MTIHELSKRTHIKVETIRSYRVKGLLHPVQNEKNKYYDYSLTDLYTLLYIAKNRKTNLSLDTIQYNMEHSDFTEIIRKHQEEHEKLETQIDLLYYQKMQLEITLQHLKECLHNDAGIQMITAFDERYDCYNLDLDQSPELQEWLDHMELFAQSIYISQENLTQTPLPEKLPIKTGIGTYQKLLTHTNLKIPSDAVHFANGTYLTFCVQLSQLDYIEAKQIQPLLDYANEHGYTICSGTTGFVYRIDNTDRPVIYFRLRVRVEKK